MHIRRRMSALEMCFQREVLQLDLNSAKPKNADALQGERRPRLVIAA